MNIKIPHELTHDAARTPTRATDGSAGYDLYSCERVVLRPRERGVVHTGVRLAIPKGWCGQIWPRSGMAVRSGIDVLAGLVDSDFRGDVGVVLVNHGSDNWECRAGDRIAQIVLVPHLEDSMVRVESLDSTGRSGGYGSTGI